MSHQLNKTHLGSQTSWKIIFNTEPTDDMVADIVENEFPAAGYGVSYISKPVLLEDKWTVFVTSNSSCD